MKKNFKEMIPKLRVLAFVLLALFIVFILLTSK